jgi:hypothetical protein
MMLITGCYRKPRASFTWRTCLDDGPKNRLLLAAVDNYSLSTADVMP